MENSSAKAVKSFMATVVVGTLICELVTVLVFAVIGRFELGVIWGALWGTAVMVIYYLMFALKVWNTQLDSDASRRVLPEDRDRLEAGDIRCKKDV